MPILVRSTYRADKPHVTRIYTTCETPDILHAKPQENMAALAGKITFSCKYRKKTAYGSKIQAVRR